MFLNLLAYIIIPMYTVFFARNTNWFTMNFSVIGSLSNRRFAFLIWGVLVGLYFYESLNRVMRPLPSKSGVVALKNSAATLLILAVLTPYLPERLPLQSFLHVLFAFTASVLLLLALYLILGKLLRIYGDEYRPYMNTLHSITAICAVLLLAAGIVSSALEIFYTISCTVLVRLMHRKITANNLSLRL